MCNKERRLHQENLVFVNPAKEGNQEKRFPPKGNSAQVTLIAFVLWFQNGCCVFKTEQGKNGMRDFSCVTFITRLF